MSSHSNEKIDVDTDAPLAAPIEHKLTASGIDWEHETIDLSWKTYAAIFALVLLQFAQVAAISSTTLLLSYIGTALNRTDLQNWIPICISVGQAAFGPILSYASDTFGQRKYWLIGPQIPFIAGGLIAFRAKSMPMLLVGQLLTGFGEATAALAYAAPSEILPRRYRPLAQGWINLGGNFGALVAYLSSGYFVTHYENGWRWPFLLTAVYVTIATVVLQLTYHPITQPRPATTLGQKIAGLDLVGNLIFFAALVLLIVGISIGDNPFPWASAKPITLMVVGFVLFIVLGVYEYWKKDGVLAREMFQNVNFPLCLLAMFIEGVVIFSFQVFFPAEASAVGWGSTPFRVAVLSMPFALASLIMCMPFGYFSSRFRNLKIPLILGYLLYTAGLVVFLTAKLDSAHWVWIGPMFCGAGFSSLLIILIAAAQLSVPPRYVATASALMVSIRAVGGSVATASYGAVLNSKTATKIPEGIASTVLPMGLPPQSLGPFIGALAGKDFAALSQIPGVTPQIIGAAVGALRKALLDSFRYIYWVALPFSIIGIITVSLFRDFSKSMNYKVDATLETDVHVHAVKEDHVA